LKRTSLTEAECPVARALDAIGDWWSLLIVRDAFDGITRFGEFRRSLGIAKGMLTTRLRDLVDCGVLQTAPASDGTAYQDYLLTEKGRALFPIVVALRQWGEAHLYAAGEPHSMLVEAATGKPVEKLDVRSAKGEVLGWSDTRVTKV
jgi:DNA-binding HxlR family transcriptional regulator